MLCNNLTTQLCTNKGFEDIFVTSIKFVDISRTMFREDNSVFKILLLTLQGNLEQNERGDHDHLFTLQQRLVNMRDVKKFTTCPTTPQLLIPSLISFCLFSLVVLLETDI